MADGPSRRHRVATGLGVGVFVGGCCCSCCCCSAVSREWSNRRRVAARPQRRPFWDRRVGDVGDPGYEVFEKAGNRRMQMVTGEMPGWPGQKSGRQPRNGMPATGDRMGRRSAVAAGVVAEGHLSMRRADLPAWKI